MYKLLTNISFVIATIVVIILFITATTYTQLAVATALYPLLIFFLFKAFPRRTEVYPSGKSVAALVEPPVNSAEKLEVAKAENISINDIDKRLFLKLIGGVGLSLFLFSIFNKKAEGLFFKNIPTTGRTALEDTAGNKIDPAQSQPMDGYRISEIDDNVITFYGFTNKDGAWVVMREDSDTGSFRYAKGDSNFPSNWTNRENLKFDYFSNIF